MNNTHRWLKWLGARCFPRVAAIVAAGFIVLPVHAAHDGSQTNSPAEPPARVLDLQATAAGVTIAVTNISLGELVGRLRALSGVELFLSSSMRKILVSEQFSAANWQAALDRLFRPYNRVTQRGKHGELKRLWLLGVGQSPPIAAVSFAAKFGPEKTVFVTNRAYDGNLGGLMGADDKCQAEADDPASIVPPGTYLAWLSDGFNSPDTRFIKSVGPYILPDGTKVAEDFADLTDGSILHNIDSDPTGRRLGLQSFWTGTRVCENPD